MAANPYDDILAAPSSVSAGGPAANPYDDILGGEQDRQQAQLRANVSLAAGSNPQAIAAQRQLAKYVGYKPAVGEALPDEIKAMASVKRVADDTAGSPVLQKAYTDADFARIGHDDSGALSAVGEAVASLTKYLMGATPTGGFIGALKATPALAAEGILGAKKAMVDVVEPWARLVTQNPDNTFSSLSKYYSARSAEEKAKAEALSPADNSIIGGGLQAGFQSLGGNSKYLPLAFLPGGAPFALAGMGIETFGHSYNRAADKNIPLMARLLYAASDATIEVATETGPLGALVQGVKAGAPFVRTMLTNAIKENKGEQVATLLQDANEWAVLNPDKPFVEYLKERPAAAVQTLIATLVGVGGNTALAEGVQRASDAVAGRQRQIDLSLDQVDKLQGLFKAALDSKVRERDPVSFGNLVQQMAEATPGAPANVFIDARALTDALAANPEAAGVFNQMPAEVQAQVQEALATGGAVEIPLGDLVAKGAGTALEAALLPHIRTSLDGLSQTEAKDAAGQAATYLQQEADRVIAESDRSETIAASADAVHSQVLDQLNAINRNTPDVNGADATLIKAFYTATSARLGMTPEEMYAKHPLSIKGETVGAGYNSQTGAFGPRFQQFKGDSAGAIAHLVQQQDGEAIGALHHPDLGDIDLVWGEAGTGASDGYGLAKLLKWHPEVVDGLQEILSSMKVASRSENRIRLESADHAASVRLSWDGQAKHWLLTAYEKRGDTGTRTDTADTSGGDDTARPTDASESIVDAKLQLASLERSVDRFVGGLSTQMSLDTQGVDFVPTDADMARLAEKIRLAAYEGDGHTQVLASKMLSTQGRYGGIERSLDMEVVAREGYNPQALWVEMLRQAQAARQDSTFLSRVLRDKEDHNPLIHRPGVEVYFKDAASAAKLEVVLADLAKEGVEFLTVIVDGRRMPGYVAGDMPAAVGVRMQYVPEFDQRYGFDDLSGLTDDEIAAKIEMKADEMSAIAERVSLVEGVAFAGTFWHETQVAFSHQYQEKIDVVATGISEEATGAVGGSQWSGQSVRSGIEDADRQVREAASGQPVGQLGDVLGGDAQRTAVGADQSQQTLGQQARGTYNPATLTISLLQTADLSTFLHEAGHFFLEVMADLASQENAPEQITADFGKILKWFGVKDAEDGTKAIDVWRAMTLDEKRPHHERWAESFEQYLIEGKAPSLELRGPFQRFRGWLTTVYKSLRDFAAGRDLKISGEIRAVMDRLVATEDQISEAEQQAKYEAVYKTAEEAGMDEHE